MKQKEKLRKRVKHDPEEGSNNLTTGLDVRSVGASRQAGWRKAQDWGPDKDEVEKSFE